MRTTTARSISPRGNHSLHRPFDRCVTRNHVYPNDNQKSASINSPFRFFLSSRLSCQSHSQLSFDINASYVSYGAAWFESSGHAAGSKQACIPSLREVQFAQQ